MKWELNYHDTLYEATGDKYKFWIDEFITDWILHVYDGVQVVYTKQFSTLEEAKKKAEQINET